MFKPIVHPRLTVHVTDPHAPRESHTILASGSDGEYYVITETHRGGAEGVTVAAEIMDAEEICQAYGVKTYELVRNNLGRGPRVAVKR